jgi:hypothetical protein
VPIDIAINQIIALTAATHASRVKPTSLRRGTTVPIYHIAAGLAPHATIPMRLFNDPHTKLASPYVSAKNLLAAYRPMITKVVKFDTARARHVLGLPPIVASKMLHETNGSGHSYTNGMPKELANGGDPTHKDAFGVMDSPVDTTGFPVDVEGAAQECGGWMRYLQMIRDKMERMA